MSPKKRVRRKTKSPERYAKVEIDRFLREYEKDIRTLVAAFRMLPKGNQRDYGLAALVLMAVLEQSVKPKK
jgi:hypothetical protein